MKVIFFDGSHLFAWLTRRGRVCAWMDAGISISRPAPTRTVNLYIILLLAGFLSACKPVKHTPSPTALIGLQQSPFTTPAVAEIPTITPKTSTDTGTPGLHEQSIQTTETATNTPRAPTPTRVSPSPTAALSPLDIAASVLTGLSIEKTRAVSPQGRCMWEMLMASALTDAAREKYGDQYFTFLTVTCESEWVLVDQWVDQQIGYAIPDLLGWSVDGKYLYFYDTIIPDGCQPLGGFQRNLRRVDLTTGDILSIPIDWTGGMALSPDTTKLVYYDWHKMEVGIYDLVTQKEQRIPFALSEQTEYWNAGNFTGSPDGQSTLFVIDYGTPCLQIESSILRIDMQKHEVTTLREKDGQTVRIDEWTEPDRVLVSIVGYKFWLNPVSGGLETLSNTPVPASPTPSPTATPAPTHFIDMSAQDGRIVAIQYYTLLGLHLFDQAYQLLSANFKASYPENAFIEDSTNYYLVVKVLKVIPAKESVGINPQAISDDWYYVEIYAEGVNGMSGPFVNGVHDEYVLVVRENGEWKIDTWGDSPNPLTPTP